MDARNSFSATVTEISQKFIASKHLSRSARKAIKEFDSRGIHQCKAGFQQYLDNYLQQRLGVAQSFKNLVYGVDKPGQLGYAADYNDHFSKNVEDQNAKGLFVAVQGQIEKICDFETAQLALKKFLELKQTATEKDSKILIVLIDQVMVYLAEKLRPVEMKQALVELEAEIQVVLSEKLSFKYYELIDELPENTFSITFKKLLRSAADLNEEALKAKLLEVSQGNWQEGNDTNPGSLRSHYKQHQDKLDEINCKLETISRLQQMIAKRGLNPGQVEICKRVADIDYLEETLMKAKTRDDGGRLLTESVKDLYRKISGSELVLPLQMRRLNVEVKLAYAFPVRYAEMLAACRDEMLAESGQIFSVDMTRRRASVTMSQQSAWGRWEQDMDPEVSTTTRVWEHLHVSPSKSLLAQSLELADEQSEPVPQTLSPVTPDEAATGVLVDMPVSFSPSHIARP